MPGPFGHKNEEMAYHRILNQGKSDGFAVRPPANGGNYDRLKAYSSGYKQGLNQRVNLNLELKLPR